MGRNEPLNYQDITRQTLNTALIVLVSALVFWAYFQLTKIDSIQAITPYADDPYDAVGSFAFQFAVLVGLVGAARAIAARQSDAVLVRRLRYIIRGGWVAVISMGVTVATDLVAVILLGAPAPSFESAVLFSGLAVIALLGVSCAVLLIALARLVNRLSIINEPPVQGVLGEAIGDMFTCVEWIGAQTARLIPPLAKGINSLAELPRRVFTVVIRAIPLADPAQHPWIFASLIAVLSGIGLAAGHSLLEGSPADWQAALLVNAIFFSAEMVAVLVGFTLLGGMLGLRPPLLQLRRNPQS